MPINSIIEPVHGSASTTFKLPPLDRSLTIPEIFDWQGEHSPNHLFFVHASGPGDKTGITFKQGVDGVHRVGRMLTDRLLKLGIAPADKDGPVIALLAASGM
jgi:hypothetical protein